MGAGARRARAAARARRSWSTRPPSGIDTILERHADPEPDFLAEPVAKHDVTHGVDPVENGYSTVESNGHGETPIRPERFARLIALAGILIQAGREGRKPNVTEVRERLQMTAEELREDLDVLNVVNFGGGSYVLYAEVQGDEIEVDPEPYSDNFARPARLLPLEAKALVAAIDLLGDHLPGGQPRLGAPEDRPGARRGPVAGGPSDRAQRRRRPGPRPHDQPGDRRLPARCRSSTTRRTRTSSPSARSSPTP